MTIIQDRSWRSLSSSDDDRKSSGNSSSLATMIASASVDTRIIPVAAESPPRNASAANGSLSKAMGNSKTKASGGANPPNFNKPAAAIGTTKMTNPRRYSGKNQRALFL